MMNDDSRPKKKLQFNQIVANIHIFSIISQNSTLYSNHITPTKQKILPLSSKSIQTQGQSIPYAKTYFPLVKLNTQKNGKNPAEKYKAAQLQQSQELLRHFDGFAGQKFLFWTRKTLRCYNLLLMSQLYNQFKTTNFIPSLMKKQMNMTIHPKRKCSDQCNSSDESECDDSYIPRFMNSRRKRLQIKPAQEQGQNTASFNNSLWKLQQNVAYMTFLQENGQLFESNWHQRKSLKINVLMSKLVKTRSPAQCRSHHQKMMKYHSTISNIINHILQLQKAAPLPKEPEEQPQTEQTPATDIVLQDLTDRWSWVEQYEDLWNKMMDERWLEGADEYYTVG